MSRKIEQVLLLLAGGGQFLEILGVNDDVASRAGHHPLAGPLQRFARSPGDVEQALPGFRFHFLVESSVGLEEAHQGHASSFSCAFACAAIRWQASASSFCVVYRPKPILIDERDCR